MIKAIYFDMDGTLCDTYNVPNWLPKLQASDPSPYHDAAPMVDMSALESLLYAFEAVGVSVGVISWAAMDDTKEYRRQVSKAKRAWLKRHCPLLARDCHVVKYGALKHRSSPHKDSIVLVDDNEAVRASWEAYGPTINPNPATLLDDLESLLWEVIAEK